MRGAATPNVLPFTGHTERTRATSRRAALRSAGGKQTAMKRVYDCIRLAPDGKTDGEIAKQLSMNPSTARPRRIDLVEAGLVKDSSRRRNRSTVWVQGAPFARLT